MRLIDADAFSKKLQDDYHGGYSEVQIAPYQVDRMIDNAPTIDAVPTTHCGKTDITVTIDENDIAKLVVEKIASGMVESYSAEFFDTKYGIRKGVEQAVKDYVYSHKDEIIEKCVDRASSELVRKGLPKLIERIGESRD